LCCCWASDNNWRQFNLALHKNRTQTLWLNEDFRSICEFFKPSHLEIGLGKTRYSLNIYLTTNFFLATLDRAHAKNVCAGPISHSKIKCILEIGLGKSKYSLNLYLTSHIRMSTCAEEPKTYARTCKVSTPTHRPHNHHQKLDDQLQARWGLGSWVITLIKPKWSIQLSENICTSFDSKCYIII
jgi:hypothetical protein